MDRAIAFSGFLVDCDYFVLAPVFSRHPGRIPRRHPGRSPRLREDRLRGEPGSMRAACEMDPGYGLTAIPG